MNDGREIGNGAYGRVVLLATNPQTVAKWVRQTDDEYRETQFEREWQTLMQLRHPNIVAFYGIEKRQDWGVWHHVIRMEYCERDSLREVIGDPTIVYNMKTVYCWAEQLFSVLQLFEQHDLIHRDLKPENVLVNDKFTLKVADFGCVRTLDKEKIPTITGTYLYMSPEMFRGEMGHVQQLSCKSDLYAVGLILWEIVERRIAHPDYENLATFVQQFIEEIETGVSQRSLPVCDERLKEIIVSCTQIFPKQRAAVGDVYPQIVEINKSYTTYEFQPKIDNEQKTLLRPLGFDGEGPRVANESIPLEKPPPTPLKPKELFLEMSKEAAQEKPFIPQVHVQEKPHEPQPILEIPEEPPIPEVPPRKSHRSRTFIVQSQPSSINPYLIVNASPISTNSSSLSIEDLDPFQKLMLINKNASVEIKRKSYNYLVDFLKQDEKYDEVLKVIREKRNTLNLFLNSYVFSLENHILDESLDLSLINFVNILHKSNAFRRMVSENDDVETAETIITAVGCWVEQVLDDLMLIYNTFTEAFYCIENGIQFEFPTVIEKLNSLQENPFKDWKMVLETYEDKEAQWCRLSRDQRLFVLPNFMKVVTMSEGEWNNLDFVLRTKSFLKKQKKPILTYSGSGTHKVSLEKLIKSMKLLNNNLSSPKKLPKELYNWLRAQISVFAKIRKGNYPNYVFLFGHPPERPEWGLAADLSEAKMETYTQIHALLRDSFCFLKYPYHLFNEDSTAVNEKGLKLVKALQGNQRITEILFLKLTNGMILLEFPDDLSKMKNVEASCLCLNLVAGQVRKENVVLEKGYELVPISLDHVANVLQQYTQFLLFESASISAGTKREKKTSLLQKAFRCLI